MNTTNKAPEREDIEHLLPWFAAGTLNRRDAARVEEALTKDPELARRFDMVREELGETIRLNESLGAPSARAMKQLFEKIEAEAPAQRQPSFNLAARLSDFIAGFSPRTLAYAGAVAALAIVLQAGVITSLIGERGGDANFRTVAIDPGARIDGSEALVRFSPQASAAEITALLMQNQAVIIGGPAAGTYRVRVAEKRLPKEQLDEIVKRLQDDKVVSFAAPAQ